MAWVNNAVPAGESDSATPTAPSAPTPATPPSPPRTCDASKSTSTRHTTPTSTRTPGGPPSIPTDCPQRDERLGWTGDLQVFAGTAATLYDCDAFLTSWLQDLALEQAQHDGVTPIVIPSAMAEDADGAVAA